MASIALRLCSATVSKRSLLTLATPKTWRQTQYFISTSKKNDESVTTSTLGDVNNERETPEQQFPSNASDEKNWISFGYDDIDRDYDRWIHNMTTFMTVTMCLVFGGFFLAYLPDHKLQSWSQREAYLELERRESLGLPRIDANLISPDKIVLPTDEELGDTEIVI